MTNEEIADELENKIWYTNRGQSVDVPEINRKLLAEALRQKEIETIERCLQIVNKEREKDFPDIRTARDSIRDLKPTEGKEQLKK